MKKWIATILALVMALGLCSVSWAEGSVEAANEKELRKALCDAATDGSVTTIKLTGDITLEMLYAAENFGDDTLADNAVGDTFNRYKKGVHPSEDDPTHWNKLVIDQTQEQRVVYGAYYNTGANDERIARLVVKAGQKVVLDLNGHTIAKNARATHGDWSNTCTDIIGNYGELTITDTAGTAGTIKGIGYISCNGAVLHNYSGATMTVGKVNVDGNAAGMAAGTGQYVISNEGTLTIDGTNVHDTATSASLIAVDGGDVTIKGNATLNHPNTKTINSKGGTTTVESATIISDTYPIYAAKGKVTVNDATIKGGELTAENDGTIVVNGGAFPAASKVENFAGNVVSVNGTYFVGTAADKAVANAGSGDVVAAVKGSVTVNGKTLNAGESYTVPSKYYYYPSASTDTTTDTAKASPKTFDAGVGVYAVTAVLSLSGMAWTAKKRH